MKWTMVVSIVFLAGIASARADAIVQERYYDLIRPHGHPRSAAVHNADLDYCYGQTGAIRGLADTPEFKECMLWAWLSMAADPRFWPSTRRPAAGTLRLGLPRFLPAVAGGAGRERFFLIDLSIRHRPIRRSQ
jgi:hypothetical protein